MLRVLGSVAATLVFASALSAAPGNSTPESLKGAPGQTQEAKPHRPKKAQVGKASWYGRIFQHHKTASGEPYNMFELTAAHRTLPLGSWVKVVDLKTDRSVVVRINDRGPVAPNRIIDLSYGAARILGMNGVDRVRLEVLQTPEIADNLGPRS
ncbi:MAG TPA: septal ring lytic transglycosylase RlpA family protein [Bryobacteraceae bacterium]|jgi:rare lipoprotein A